MTGTDSATAKENYASVSHSADIKGYRIYSTTEAYFESRSADDGPSFGTASQTQLFTYFWDDTLNTMVYPIPEKANRLNGKATATVDEKKGATLSGSWKADLARDVTQYPDGCTNFARFSRTTDAYYGDNSDSRESKRASKEGALSFSFKESGKASKSSVDAA